MLYREFLSYDGPVVYLYEQWVEEMESQERENIMRYLSRALACDLQALPLGDINISEFGDYFLRVGRLRELQSLEHVFTQQFFQSGLFRQHSQLINSEFAKSSVSSLPVVFVTKRNLKRICCYLFHHS